MPPQPESVGLTFWRTGRLRRGQVLGQEEERHWDREDKASDNSFQSSNPPGTNMARSRIITNPPTSKVGGPMQPGHPGQTGGVVETGPGTVPGQPGTYTATGQPGTYV